MSAGNIGGFVSLKPVNEREASMPMTRNLIALVGMSLVVGSVSTGAVAQSRRTAAAAERDVQQLIRMMDADRNGVVSKEEFMNYMSQTFDRLDVNKSGTLEPNELRRMTIPRWELGQEAPIINQGGGRNPQ
jgi:EF hand domain-containing protein